MTNSPSTITPQIFLLSLVLSVIWGAVLFFAIKDYRGTIRLRRSGDRRRTDLVASLRWLLVVLAVWMLNSAYLFRTGMVLAGFGDVTAGQILFFTLASTDIVSGVFALVSRWFD